MTALTQLLASTLGKVFLAFAHNWYYLLASVLVGSLIKLFLDQDQVAAYLRRNQAGGVAAGTLVAVGTPLCSCGTTAVVIGMMASRMPWAPIVAFMVSSPLTSPEGLPYTAGLFGWPFAIAYFVASILLGLGGGLVAGLLEKGGWLKDQARLTPSEVRAPAPVAVPPSDGCGCGSVRLQAGPAAALEFSGACDCGSVATAAIPPSKACGCGTPAISSPGGKVVRPPVTLTRVGRQLAQDAPRLLAMFFTFAFLGYLLNSLIPAAWITALFGGGNAYSVPLAATLGLPFYFNAEASLPLVRAMLDSGMSQGAALAFLIAGAGTSIGAIGGALTIAKWRVIVVVVATLWVGAILAGLVFDLLAAVV